MMLMMLSLMLSLHGLGSAWIEPAQGILQPGDTLTITVVFDPAITATVTGLDACFDFDGAVFLDPSDIQHYINDNSMANFSFENNWSGHPNSFHYERIALPGYTGWSVTSGAQNVYTVSLKVQETAPPGQTTISFTPNFITFSDAYGELLNRSLVYSGNYTIVAPDTPTPTPSAAPTLTLTPTMNTTPPVIPSMNGAGVLVLALLLSALVGLYRIK